jgi:hypothetical protein
MMHHFNLLQQPDGNQIPPLLFSSFLSARFKSLLMKSYKILLTFIRFLSFFGMQPIDRMQLPSLTCRLSCNLVCQHHITTKQIRLNLA